jgi:hypothetical protein
LTSLESAERTRPDKINSAPRRTVRLDFDQVTAESTNTPPVNDDTPKSPASDRVLRLAEHAVGDMAPTLRLAFLMLTTFAAVVVLVGVTLGFGGAVAGALLGTAALYLVTRGTG